MINMLMICPSPSDRYVANRLSEIGETAMSPCTSSDMGDVDMASIAEDELSEKFSVQGVATGKTSGKTKIVSISLWRWRRTF